jgi:hypothetical protein
LNGREALKKTMDDQGIQGPDVFEHWLEEERAYLRALAKEPVHETLEMDYYLALVNLETAEYVAILLIHLSWPDDTVERNLLQSVTRGQTILPMNRHRTLHLPL